MKPLTYLLVSLATALALIQTSCSKNTVDNPQQLDTIPFDCSIPKPEITGFEKTETTIKISWSKASITHFNRYELYVARTDTTNGLIQRDSNGAPHPILPNKLVATITDPAINSFVDDSVSFLYKYEYRVRVVSDSGCDAFSDVKGIEAGTFLLFEGASRFAAAPRFDRNRNRFYIGEKLNPETSEEKSFIQVVDPQQLKIIHSIPINENFVRFDVSPDGSELRMIEFDLWTNLHTLFRIDPDNFDITQIDTITLPPYSTVQLLQNNKIIFQYKDSYAAPYHLASMNLSNRAISEILPEVVTGLRTVSSHPTSNNLFIAVTGSKNYVFDASGSVPSIIKELENTEYGQFPSSDLASAHTVYDENFETSSVLPDSVLVTSPQTFPYYATTECEIFNFSDHKLVSKFGNVRSNGSVMHTPFAYFPAKEPEKMYVYLAGGLGNSWNPIPRLYRYPFMKQ